MSATHPSRETYIIRLWQIAKNGETWRGQAQNVRTGQQVVIHSLLDLMACFEDFFSKDEVNQPDSKKSGLK